MKNKKLTDICGKENPFTVPEGYFEQFTKQLMDKLPEKETVIETPQPINTWQRIKPWIYLAAMFGGIMFCAKYMLGTLPQENSDTTTQIASKAVTITDDIEQSYDEEYIENELMNSRMDDYSVYCYLTNTDQES